MNIKNYTIKAEIFQGKKFHVYHAVRTKDSLSCILKLVEKQATRSGAALKALKNEYTLLRKFDSPYIIRVLDSWVEEKDYAAIVLEDIDGKTLKEESDHVPLSIEKFIELARHITKGLEVIHRHHIIHQDINPGNIIFNPHTTHLQIIDFDISTSYDLKVSYSGNPEKLEGTLPYISPEQTGRMNRTVDQRSDLYSLGVTFYELLTGQRPFSGHDPMELVYAHLAKMPESPCDILGARGIVPLRFVSDIIMKLLAKDPADRYQSAQGLLYDLDQIQQATLTGVETLSGFTLASKDFSGTLHIPEKLYGREQEIEQLLGAYQRVSEGAQKMLLVAGYSGTGKTSLVNAIQTSITRDQGYFISGKFEQLQRTIPFFALTQALNQFCQLLLTENQETLTQWKNRILEAVENLGQVLTDVIPLLEQVIGHQPDVPEVGAQEARQRFNYVFQRFLQAVSMKEHPLVMFLDDLQWADLASLNLLQLVMEDSQHHYLFLVGAYRDNEVSPTHPLSTALEDIQKHGAVFTTIPVKNLSRSHVHEWLRDALQTEQAAGTQDITPLADLIYEKTQGNAFFTIQFLRNLYEEQLLVFDGKQEEWRWNFTDITQQNFTDNVVELLTRKIRTLPTAVQHDLTFASCIGSVFDLKTLAVIAESSPAEHQENVELAVKEHLLVPVGDESYAFVHARVHQAAYLFIAECERAHLHLKIGRLLLTMFDISDTSHIPEEAESHLFDIVNHLNIGVELIEETTEKIRLAHLNLNAARQARLSTAYALGKDYVQMIFQLLPDNYWELQYDLTLAAHNEATQTCYLLGNFDEMEDFVQTLLASARTIDDMASAYEYRILGLMAQNQMAQAVDMSINIFRELGVDIPRAPDQTEFMNALGTTEGLLAEKGETLTQLPMMSDVQRQLVVKLFYVGGVAFLFGAQEIFPFVNSKMIGLILESGLTEETPYLLSLYGLVRLHMENVPGTYQLGDISMELLEKRIGNPVMKVRALGVICFYILGLKKHFKDVCQLILETYPYAVTAGDLEYAGYFAANYVLLISRTDTNIAEVRERAQHMQTAAIQVKQAITLPPIQIEIAFNASLSGENPNPAKLDLDLEKLFQTVPQDSQRLYGCQVNIKQTILAYLFENSRDILEYMEAAEEKWKNLAVPITFMRSDLTFYFPLAYLRLSTETTDEKEKERYLNKAREGMTKMKSWAEFGPVNFLHKSYLQQAELHRIQGEIQQAGEYYDKAIETSLEHDYVNEAALANELAAQFYIQQNHPKLARLYVLEARECYQKWGAVAKVKHLEDRYPKYLRQAAASGTSRTTTSTGTTAAALDTHTILKATRALSGEVQIKSLLENMLRIVLENAGAQRGLFLEPRDKTFLIQAAGSVDGVTDVLAAIPAEDSGQVPISLINYVARSKEQLVFDNLSQDAAYHHDPYVQQHQPQSAACVPVLKQGELSAMLYLENNAVEGAFTPARLEVLNMLSAQIAISVENAELYENLEERVRRRTAELRQAHSELEQAHTALTDNVNYAVRIQKAVLPESERMAEFFPEHFILFKPHSVVSGDFYWMREVDGRIVVAAVDCTGHGVSGALVSMLGTAFLNEIVPLLSAQSRLAAHTILDELREKVKSALKQEGALGEQKEGMDLALCILDPARQQLQFAGAYNPLYLIRSGELIEIKADRMPIGIYRREKPFTQHDMAYQPGDMLYLFTDGFIDQHSEAGTGGFSKKRFRQFLLDIHQEPAAAQQDRLTQAFEEWKGDLPQTDDVLVVGIRL